MITCFAVLSQAETSNQRPSAKKYLEKESGTFATYALHKSIEKNVTEFVGCYEGKFKDQFKVSENSDYPNMAIFDKTFENIEDSKRPNEKLALNTNFRLEIEPDGTASLSLNGFFYPTPDAGFNFMGAEFFNLKSLNTAYSMRNTIDSQGKINIEVPEPSKPEDDYTLVIELNPKMTCAKWKKLYEGN